MGTLHAVRRLHLASLGTLLAACDDARPMYTPLADASPDVAVIVDAGPAFRPLPEAPVGTDALRRWSELHLVRVNVRAGMTGTWDRAGGNAGNDAGHFVRAERDTYYSPLELEGVGVLYFAGFNAWRGSPWHFLVDGVDRVVTETTTVAPDRPADDARIEPAAALPSPLAFASTASRGGDLVWLPMAFNRTLSVGFGRTHRAAGDFIYHRFPAVSDSTSPPLRTWDGASPPDPEVLSLLRRAGDDIAPPPGELQTRLGTVDVPARGAVTLVATGAGPGIVRALQLRVVRERALALGRARIRITWDDRAAPSVDAPVDLFFGAGVLYNRDVREHLVKGLLTNVRYAGDNVELTAYFPMPFFRSARVELVGDGEAVAQVSWQARSGPFDGSPAWTGYFHATARDHGAPTPGVDLTFLDTREAEGGGDWCGLFAGTSFTYSDRADQATLEGDPRFFFDDAVAPQGHGTSTAAWAGGGIGGWGGRTVTLPLAGHPAGAPDMASARAPEDRIQSAYRHLVADAMPFGRNARIQFEHGGANESTEHYRSVTYWYGRPGACLVRTDALDVGDAADERAHRYVNADSAAPETLTSRYELGVERAGGREVVPAVTDAGRRVTTRSEFTVRLDPSNVGVMLRRTYDASIPEQRAEVLVAEDRDGAGFESAGYWFNAGSNVTVYSDAATETGIPMRELRTSPRRWREDEFLLPRRLTERRGSIRVRVRPAPVERPVVVGMTARASAWSEFRYQVYAYVLPAR